MVATSTSTSVEPVESASDLRRFEDLLVRLSAKFISLQPSEMHGAIDAAMQSLAEALDVDRCTILKLHADGALTRVNSWTRPGHVPAVLGQRVMDYPWGVQMLVRGKPVIFSSTDELPPEAAIDKASFDRVGPQSFVSMPLLVAGKLYGALNFLCKNRRREWPEHLVGRLRLVAEILGNAIARKHAQEELEQQLAFERMIGDVAALLMSLPFRDLDAAIEAGLERTAGFLDVHWVALWTVSHDGPSLSATHQWAAGDARMPTRLDAADLPWMVRQLVGNGLVRLGSLDELPSQAAADAATLRAWGLGAMLGIPLRSGGAVVGILSLATLGSHREWPDVIVPRVLLLGEIFATALARKNSEQRVVEARMEAAQHRERLAHLVRLHTVGEMSAGITHEISQPLIAIENYAIAASRYVGLPGESNTAKLSELLGKVIAQSSRAGEVMRKLRSMVKRHEFEMNKLAIGDTVRESLRFAEMEGQLQDVQIDCRIAQALPDVIADEIQIQQVIVNLVRNASDAMSLHQGQGAKRLEIDVATGPDDRFVHVCIADSGPGFALEDCERIFDPFYSTKSAGLGVGLSLCRSIVQAHGGHLVARLHDTGGAIFEFALPVHDEGAP